MRNFTYSAAGNICPLCKRLATCTLCDYDAQKHVRCDQCVEFVITCPAEERLASMPTAYLEQLSMRARQSNDERLFFITRPLPNSEELVHCEFRPRYQ